MLYLPTCCSVVMFPSVCHVSSVYGISLCVPQRPDGRRQDWQRQDFGVSHPGGGTYLQAQVHAQKWYIVIELMHVYGHRKHSKCYVYMISPWSTYMYYICTYITHRSKEQLIHTLTQTYSDLLITIYADLAPSLTLHTGVCSLPTHTEIRGCSSLLTRIQNTF